MSDKDDGIKQNLLFDDSELESCNQVWTPDEIKLLNSPKETQIEYIRNFLISKNYKPGQIGFEEVNILFPKFICELINRTNLIYIQMNYLVATQEEKIALAINYLSKGKTVKDICNVLLCKKTVVYKWQSENKEVILQNKIAYLEERIEEYKTFNCFPTQENQLDFFESQIADGDFERLFIKNDDDLRRFIFEKHKGDNEYFEKQQTQYLDYVQELEKTKLELNRLNTVKDTEEETDVCKTATTITNDIITNDWYDFITYYDDLDRFSNSQMQKSHSLELTPKYTDTEIVWHLYKDKTKDLVLQMPKPNKNVNMAYMRDIFVLAMQQLATLDKEQLTPENLRLNPQKINISTQKYCDDSNYKNLRKVQEMSKDANIKFLGNLAIFGKSYIYDGKGRSKKILEITGNVQKKYIPMFKSVGYQNNNIELVLNDEFPWQAFTLKYFTKLPDNYLKLSENGKTLLMYIVSQARIKSEPEFKIDYSDLQILFNLKTYEEDKKHATERIIKPIRNAIEEIKREIAYFVIIDTEENLNRTPKEILDTGFITVKVLHDIKENIDTVNHKRNEKIKKAIKRNKKTSQK